MCGISGIINKTDKSDRNEIIKMNGMISHRGPDQSGYLDYKNLLLGHVRLSVIDISDNGRQPLSNDGRYWIIFNGEIYNYKEIKNELIEKKYKFYSKTDTEVVLNAYIEWGNDCFKKFNGDWVISILDKKKDLLIIARDQIGCKPCYIYEDEKKIAFSSEIKSFMALNTGLKFDNRNIGIMGPTLYSFSKTIFKNVTQLPPGRLIEIEINSLNKKISRWSLPLENLPKIHPNYEVNQAEYYELLYNATKLRLNADLKIGTSLSGGLDSAAIFMLLNLIQRNDNILDSKKLDLNPTIMDFKECRTTNFAVELANNYKRKHTIINSPEIDINSIQDLSSRLEIVEQYLRQPLLYEKQKELGIHVSIDGHGADEFLGMPSFFPHLSLSNFNQIVNINNATNDYGSESLYKPIKDLFGSVSDNKNLAKYNFINLLNINNPLKKHMLNEEFIPDNLLINEDLDILENFDLATQFIYFKTHCGFMQWFLSKWDRASMSSAVEVRSPFLDKNVALYSLSLPLDKKVRNGKTKSILRDSMDSLLPKKIVEQKFKQGLPILDINLENQKNLNFISDIINEKEFKESGIWDIKNINKDFSDKKNILLIWHICKHHLMIKGFQKRLSDVIDTYDHTFYKPNNLFPSFK